MIAGIVLAYRGKYLRGLIVTGIFAAFEVHANHVQMTYYYLFVIAAMILAYLAEAIQKKQYVHFLKATGACIVGGLLGILVNISNLYHTWEYGQESMRGKSELVKKNTANQTSSGLDRDYITQWSYGIGETWTLLVPNAKGGSHNEHLGDSKSAMEASSNQQGVKEFCAQWYSYWGEQPFTAGPVYVGAFILFLFVLSLFIVKGPMKWALLGVTILTVMLSWGKNFMWLTNIFIDYVPMYASFRTVSSILVVAEFTIPLMAMMALKKIVDEPEVLKDKMKYVYISFGLTGGMAMIFALMPTMFFDFISSADLTSLKKYVGDEYLGVVSENLSNMREAVFTADCWRSFFIILAGVVLLLLYRAKKLKPVTLVGALVILSLADLWQINKRYLNDSMFVPKYEREQKQPLTQTDQLILKDQTLDYRVLNLASNTFNENETSYYHKSIGGYHAAKLRRYQELIDAHIAPEMQSLFSAISKAGGDMREVNGDSIYPVLNMLNMRYIILPLQSGQNVPLQNPYTYGNAWFVDKVHYANNANEELEAVGRLPLRHEAVADKKFSDVLGESTIQDSVSIVTIENYEPNQLTYKVRSGQGGVVVFSEIYYPGWTATIDGEEAELGRVNYVLRALKVAPGEHEVVLSFFPKSVDRTETIAYISLAILLLLIPAVVFLEYRRRKQQPTP